MHAGPAVRRRRTLVKHPIGCALAASQRFAEDVLLAPAREHRRFERNKVETRVDRAEHVHRIRVQSCTERTFGG